MYHVVVQFIGGYSVSKTTDNLTGCLRSMADLIDETGHNTVDSIDVVLKPQLSIN